MFRPLCHQPPLSRRLLLPALAGLMLASLPVLIPGAVSPAMAQSVTIEIGQFEPALSPYGRWFDHPGYGRIWQPGGIGPDWQPYTDGYWAYTNDDTWLWVANEPWGWAPYHYGRWLYLDPIGWVWRPGRVWAPAWVVWRFGGGYYGWAPAPFDDDWDAQRFNGAYWSNRVPARQWIFVRSGAFTHHHIRQVMVPRHSNDRLFRETHDITRSGQRRHDDAGGRDRRPDGDQRDGDQRDDNQRDGRRHPDAVIQGPRERDIRRETGRPVVPARVVESDAPGPAVRSGNEVRLYRPDRRGNNDQSQPGRQRPEQPGAGGATRSRPDPRQPDAQPPNTRQPDARQPDTGQERRPEGGQRADQRVDEALPGDRKPGKPDQPRSRPQGNDGPRGGAAPGEPTTLALPRTPQVMAPNMPEVRRPEVRQPEVRQPEVRQPEVRQPEVSRPEVRKPEIRQPEIRQPEMNQPPQQPRRQEPQRTAPAVPYAPTQQGRPPEPRVVPMPPQPQRQQYPSGPGADFRPPEQRQRQQQDMQPQPQRQQPQRQQGQQGQRSRPQQGAKPGEVPPQGDGGN